MCPSGCDVDGWDGSRIGIGRGRTQVGPGIARGVEVSIEGTGVFLVLVSRNAGIGLGSGVGRRRTQIRLGCIEGTGILFVLLPRNAGIGGGISLPDVGIRLGPLALWTRIEYRFGRVGRHLNRGTLVRGSALRGVSTRGLLVRGDTAGEYGHATDEQRRSDYVVHHEFSLQHSYCKYM
jgi:hypothetical protein